MTKVANNLYSLARQHARCWRCNMITRCRRFGEALPLEMPVYPLLPPPNSPPDRPSKPPRKPTTPKPGTKPGKACAT